LHIDPARQSSADNYKLLTNLVVPRPIAWITSLGEQGQVNLAPFSFFNAVGANPLYIIVSVGRRPDGTPKDTARNILASGEFVVNLVTEDLFEKMNISAADFPVGSSELLAAELHTAPSTKVGVPRVAEAKVSLECKLFLAQPLGADTLIIAEVVMFHVADALIDAKLNVKDFAPIGRLGSPSVYCRSTDRFNVARLTYAQWLERGARNDGEALAHDPVLGGR
jgi:flavin reductase (DIM6/NTAB) family NADH-FMN oxidoreductase RutF